MFFSLGSGTVLDTRAGVRHINPSLIEIGQCFGGNPSRGLLQNHVWAALPEILVGLKLAVIRGRKGSHRGQLAFLAVVGLGDSV